MTFVRQESDHYTVLYSKIKELFVGGVEYSYPPPLAARREEVSSNLTFLVSVLSIAHATWVETRNQYLINFWSTNMWFTLGIR
jgi:hypothetical protein